MILIAVVLFIRSPWGQAIVVEKASAFIREKTDTEFHIGRLYITFSGNVYLEDFYLEDQNQDTLLYSKKLEAGLALAPFFSTGKIHVTKLHWEDLKARVSRREETGKFNFDFLLEAFAADSSATDTPTDTTASDPLIIEISSTRLRNFDLSYQDEELGIDALLRMGELEVDIPEINLETYFFEIEEVALRNTQVKYHQTKAFPPSEEEAEEAPLPILELGSLSLSQVSVDYQSEPDQMEAQADVGWLEIQLPEANLAEQLVHLKSAEVQETKIRYADYSTAPVQDSSSESEGAEFTWPEWDVRLDKISIEGTELAYQTVESVGGDGVFDPNNILIQDLLLDLEDLQLDESAFEADLNDFHFKERSGFEVETFRLGLEVSSSETRINDLEVKTNRSQLELESLFEYSSISQLINQPDLLQVDLAISDTYLDLRDAYFFSPELAQDTLLSKLAQAPIRLEGTVSGDTEALDLDQLDLAWSETRLTAHGRLRDWMDPDRIAVDLPEIHIASVRQDLVKWVDEQAMGIKLPEELEVNSQIRGSLQDIWAKVEVESSLGEIFLDATYQDSEQLAFDAKLDVQNFQLGNLLQIPELDTLSFQVLAKGSGRDLYALNAELTSVFERLPVYGGDYSGLLLEGKLVDGTGDVQMALDQEFLKFDLSTHLDLDSVNSKINLALNLEGADFKEMGLAGENSRAKLQLEADFEGNPESFDLKAFLHDGNVFYKDRNYQTGDLQVDASLRPDSTSVTIDSKVVNGYVRTNTDPSQLQQALSELFTHYLDSSSQASETQDSLVMQLDLSISDDPLLSEVLLGGLEDFDSAKIKVDFVQARDSLVASVDFPYINYAGTEIDSLRVRINADRTDLYLELGFLALNTGPIAMQKTSFSGVLENSMMNMDFYTYHEEEVLAHVPFQIGIHGDSVEVHLIPEDLILDNSPWQIPKSNLVVYSTGNLEFREFDLSSESQRLQIQNDIPGFTEKNLAVDFSDFRLETLTGLLNATDTLAGGALQGQLVVENPFGATGIMGKLRVEDLIVMDTHLGNLDLEATAKSLGNYLLNLGLQDEGVELGLEGSFVADEAGGTFDLNLDLDRIDMEKIASLSQGQLTEGKGYISGTVKASGSTNDPRYEGEFQFQEASVIPTQLSTTYVLSDEVIRLDNEGVYLDQFTIRDGEGNTFAIDGTVLTKSYTNPSFDLQITAKNFLAINSSNEDNELVYGKASLDADVTVQGDLNLPVVRANLKVRNNTDLTVIIPESELDVVERQGVVTFVNKSDPDDILTRPLDQTSSGFSGYDIQASLAVDPEANFKIVIDPYTGDNLTIAGVSELRLEINPNGRMTMTGDYEVNDGFYEMTLYNLISKKFEINSGSRITWNGDPMDASMDIQAIYEVETSASDLMASQLTGSNTEVKSQYQQRLTFLVYLNVKGELLKPEITFALDMPENQRGAFGGNVYSRVLQLNGQEDELNKQVFSLLVLDRFFPSQGSDGSNGGAEAIARNSASQILSDQMNALSSKLFGDTGFSLGFDVDSYQDYQTGTAQNRTDLNINAQQKLFDDRVIVKVGSQVGIEGNSQSQEEEANALLANISFEYLLTEDGRWRIRAFRENQFESIIDGQLFVTGLGLIFNRDFNEFSELWRPPVKDEEDSEEQSDSSKKNQQGTKKEENENEKE